MGTVVLVVFCIATWTVSRGMQRTTLVSNLGLGLGTIVPAVALITMMFVWLGEGRTSQIALDVADVVPPFDGLSSVALVVGTFVAFAGLEVHAVHIDHMNGPPTAYLRAVLLAAGTVLTLYLLGSLAISVVVPDSSLELTSGASQAFGVYAEVFGVPGLANLLSMLLVAGAIRNIPGYALGAWLPTFFKRNYGVSDYGIPVGLVILFGGGLGSFLGGFISDRSVS